jgi:NDP-sugar pyrophosphorylase family protein
MRQHTEVIGIGLAGGQGVRARPLTLKAPGYLRSKAAMSFLGRRLIQWVIQVLNSEGLKQYYVVAHGKENRYQIKVLLGYGDRLGVDVQYSPVKFDSLSKGSADSTLRLADHWDLGGTALIFPTDTIIDFDLEPMIEAHRRNAASVTIAAMTRAPDEVAEKYGVMLTAPDGRITDFVEKPTLAEIREHFELHEESEFEKLPLLTNAGFYLVDMEVLRECARDPEIEKLRERRLDFGKDLLPWMVGRDYRVFSYTVRRIGDLGNVADFLETMIDALHGRFESVDRLLGAPIEPDGNVWIAPESLNMRDERSGKSLAEKMAEGSVKIGPAVRIGRYCEIEPGVTIVESNLDDDVQICEGASIRRSQIRDGAIVGPGARLSDTIVGSMSEIRSAQDDQTVIEDLVALGDEVTVYSGVYLAGGVSVFPRLKIPPGISVPRGAEVAGPADVLRYL